MKYEFTSTELLKQGFKEVLDGDEVYFEYVFDEEDYFNSKFLATESINIAEMSLRNVKYWRVINPLDEDGEPFLNEKQINEMIYNKGF